MGVISNRDIQHKRSESTAAEDAAKKKKRERKATKDLKLLSFGDEEEEFQQEVAKKSKKSKKLMSSHDLLDDRKLKAQVDEELLQKIAETANGDSNTRRAGKSSDDDVSKKETARASLKAAVASAAAKKSDNPRSVAGSSDPSNAQDAEVASTNATQKKRSKSKGDEPDEYTRLREELRTSKKAAPVLMGSKAKEQDDAKAFHDMLTPLQQQRQKYLQKKKASSRSGRQQETLQKLMQFKAKLEVVNKSHGDADGNDGSGDDKTNGSKKGAEGYHGQILDDDSDDDDAGKDDDDGGADAPSSSKRAEKEKDLSWMTAKLKFKKHIDVRISSSEYCCAEAASVTANLVHCAMWSRTNSALASTRQWM